MPQASKVASASDCVLQIHKSFQTAETGWRALEATSVPAPFQTFDWCREWWGNIGSRSGATLSIVIGYGEHGTPVFIVPFSITTSGGLRIASLLGDRHSASLGGLFDRKAIAWLASLPTGTLTEVIGQSIQAGVLHMPCLPMTLDGLPHPLLGRHTPVARGEALSIATLGRDWDAFDAAHRSGDTRRRERKNENQLGKIGPVEFLVAQTPAERDRIFNAMAAQKSGWLKSRGLHDFFADPGVTDFLRIVSDAHGGETGLQGQLTALTVGGDIAAVTFGIVHQAVYSGMIMSSADGPLHKFAPGALLLTKTMRHNAENGIEQFSFGAVAGGEGTSDWKARWCDVRVGLADVTVPLSALGRTYQLAAQAKASATGYIRSKPELLKLARNARSKLINFRARSVPPAQSTAAL